MLIFFKKIFYQDRNGISDKVSFERASAESECSVYSGSVVAF